MRDPMSRMPCFTPEVEALLAHERSIPHRFDFTRARVLARARKSLKDGNLTPFTVPALATHHLPYAAAAGLALVIATAAFQVLRTRSTDHAMNDGLASSQSLASAAEERQDRRTPAQEAETVPTVDSGEAVTPDAVTATKHDTVVEELAILEQAQQAASRDDHAAVLAITRDHEVHYPKGRLSEEREALRVRAMIGLGRLGEARQTAARFHRSFPRSVLLSRLDDMLTSR